MPPHRPEDPDALARRDRAGDGLAGVFRVFSVLDRVEGSGGEGGRALGIGADEDEQRDTSSRTRKSQRAASSVPKIASSAAVRNGPTNRPKRKAPPRSESARARKASGTRVVMNECRARPKTAAQNPMRKTAADSTARVVASSAATAPSAATPEPSAIVTRSPNRATAHPAGRLPHSWPTTRNEVTRAAAATSPPSCEASTGMSGTTAPSPSEKSTVGP